MRKPIQIAAVSAVRDITVLAVLCNDGAIFETWEDEDTGDRHWVEVDGMPQSEVAA